MKGTDPADHLKERELREAIAAEERRLGELGEEARRGQARLAALQSALASVTGASAAEANTAASAPVQRPTSTPRSSAEKIALFRTLFRGRDDVYPVGS